MAWVITSPCCCGGAGTGGCGILGWRGGWGVRGWLPLFELPGEDDGLPPPALPVGRGGVHPPPPGGVLGADIAEGSSWGVVCAGGRPNILPWLGWVPDGPGCPAPMAPMIAAMFVPLKGILAFAAAGA